MSPFWAILGLAAAYEVGIQVKETRERHSLFRQAREYSDSVGKPLLRIGVRRSPLEPPNGDVTLDLDPVVTRIPGGVHGDERNMPFSNRMFGACFNEHTLEHLGRPGDVQAAVEECCRVAEVAMFLCPSPYSLFANLFNRTHHLRLWFNQETNSIIVTSNRWNTGLGIDAPARDNQGQVVRMGQHIIAEHGYAPKVEVR